MQPGEIFVFQVEFYINFDINSRLISLYILRLESVFIKNMPKLHRVFQTNAEQRKLKILMLEEKH